MLIQINMIGHLGLSYGEVEACQAGQNLVPKPGEEYPHQPKSDPSPPQDNHSCRFCTKMKISQLTSELQSLTAASKAVSLLAAWTASRRSPVVSARESSISTVLWSPFTAAV